MLRQGIIDDVCESSCGQLQVRVAGLRRRSSRNAVIAVSRPARRDPFSLCGLGILVPTCPATPQ